MATRAFVVLAVVSALLTAVVGSADSAPGGSYADATAVVTGDFDGDGWGDVVTYRAGRAPDTVAWGPDRVPVPLTVDGSYVPLVGDFTGDGADELLWYAPGPAGDVLWHWRNRAPQAQSLRVDGRYAPVVGDFDGNGRDDVLWYAAGPGGDPVWLARSFDSGFVSRRTSIDGTYRIVAGDFDGSGRDDLLLHGRGPAPDYLSRFRSGLELDHWPVTLDGDLRMAAGEFGGGLADDVLLVGADGAAHLWSDPAVVGGAIRRVQVPVHRTAVVGDLGRDDRDDVLFVDAAGTGDVRFGDDHDFTAVEDDTFLLLGDSLGLESGGHFVARSAAHRGDDARAMVMALGGLAPCDHSRAARRTHARSVVLTYVGNAFTPCMGEDGMHGRERLLARYGRDVRLLVDQLLASGAESVVIAGPPDLRNQSLADIRALYATIASERPQVSYHFAGRSVHGPDGYTDTLPCRSFEGWSHGCRRGRIRVRAHDGVHLCPGWACPPVWSSGANRYGAALADGLVAASPPRLPV